MYLANIDLVNIEKYCFLLEKITEIQPIMVNVISARSKLGIKINRKSADSTKAQVLKWVKSNTVFSNFKWPIKVLKSGKRKDMAIDDPSCYDIADASVVALSFIVEQGVNKP